MAPRTSSPTSMLWAHQLKREHGYLLKRMQELETSNERQAKKSKTAERDAKSGSSADIDALAKQIKALDESGVGKRLSKLEDEMKHKTEDLEAGTEAITIQVGAMQKDADANEDEKRKAFSREKALLKRIGEIETGLKTYEQALVQMGRKVDETRLEQIREQLKGLEKQVAQEGSQMKMLTESVTALEAVNEELRKSNQKFAAEIEKLAGRPTTVVCVREAEADVGDEQEGVSSGIDVAPRKAKKKKKSHKWSGGGADRDIVMSGTQMLGDSAFTSTTMQQNGDDEQLGDSIEHEPPRKKGRPPKPKPKHKPIPPHLRPATSTDPAVHKKSHKWNGGGTDRDIIRSGRGWIEVVEVEEESDGATQKVRHPKKRNPTPRWTVDEAMTQERASRRGKPSQPAKVEDAPKPAAPPITAKVSAKTKKAAEKLFDEITTKAQKRKPGQNIFTSSLVIASPPNAQASPQVLVPAPCRRRILQD